MMADIFDPPQPPLKRGEKNTKFPLLTPAVYTQVNRIILTPLIPLNLFKKGDHEWIPPFLRGARGDRMQGV
jgi:hypothetical protein